MTINEQDFCVRPRHIGGELCYLVFLKSIAVKWTIDTLKYRSSIWTKEDKLISAGFPKFFNWGEADHIVSPPETLVGANVVEKIDGSSLIFSIYNGEPIIRTRGTSSLDGFTNAKEIDILLAMYPNIRQLLSEEYSLIFEWYSPSNIIVMTLADTPDCYLIGKIYHEGYRLETQDNLDELARVNNFKRPRRFNFNSLVELLDTIKKAEQLEGACLYYDNDQHIKKIKSLWYLRLHAIKNDINLENVLNIYIENKMPNYSEFEQQFKELLDFEAFSMARSYISKIFDVRNEVNAIIEHMRLFADKVKTLSRKEAAAQVLSAYGKTSRSSMVFTFLDGNELDNDQIKKLYFQLLKK